MSDDALHNPLSDSCDGFHSQEDGLWLYDELTDDICRKVLCKDGEIYSDEEIKQIRELMEEWGEIFSEQLLDNKNEPK